MAKRRFELLRGEAKIGITVDSDRTELALSTFGKRIADFRRFWTQYFAPQYFEDIQRNFAAQGRFVGGWRALSPQYALWKLKRFGPLPILVRTGAMRESFTIGGRGNVLRPSKARLVLGSTDRKVPYHQRGTRRMPRRQIIWIGPTQTYQRLLNRFVREEAQDSGLRTRSA
jgi:hypothetical protein